MTRPTQVQTGATVIELEFDTGTRGGALLGDMAASLVSLDDLLRDLASMTADPSNPEFRQVEIAAIDLRSPLRITLSLIGIPSGAVKAFQEICRGVILSRERTDLGTTHLPNIHAAIALCTPDAVPPCITEREEQRLQVHIANLQNAEISLKRVEVKPK